METSNRPMGKVFEYLDFRVFLRDRYQSRKSDNPALSLRYIAHKIGVNPGTLHRVIKGERNLDSQLAARLGHALGLSGDELEFFETLVLFGQARSQTEKNHFYEKLLRLSRSKVKTLDERQYEYYRKWYHVALRELLNTHPFDGDYKKLGSLLRPPIGPKETRRAIELLIDMGLVEKDPEGRLRLTQSLISSGQAIPTLFTDNFHLAMGRLAEQAIQEIDPDERSFSSLTMSLSPAGLESMRMELRRFRKQVLEIAERDQAVNSVYQVNFQIFPLSQPIATAAKARPTMERPA